MTRTENDRIANNLISLYGRARGVRKDELIEARFLNADAEVEVVLLVATGEKASTIAGFVDQADWPHFLKLIKPRAIRAGAGAGAATP